jgi:Ca2+-binding EF-hand superfamily protein
MRLNSNYETVRKAFLALDADHDGYITVEDFLRGFEGNDLNFNDLKKLIESKSKDTYNKGKLSYEDFSSWVGNSIN